MDFIVENALKKEPLARIIEEPDINVANQLDTSGDFCQPRFSEKRNYYILIRRRK